MASKYLEINCIFEGGGDFSANKKKLQLEIGDEIRNPREYKIINDKMKRIVDRYNADNKITIL